FLPGRVCLLCCFFLPGRVCLLCCCFLYGCIHPLCCCDQFLCSCRSDCGNTFRMNPPGDCGLKQNIAGCLKFLVRVIKYISEPNLRQRINPKSRIPIRHRSSPQRPGCLRKQFCFSCKILHNGIHRTLFICPFKTRRLPNLPERHPFVAVHRIHPEKTEMVHNQKPLRHIGNIPVFIRNNPRISV